MVLFLQQTAANADKPTRRFYRSVKVTKHGTIPYVRYGFLLVFYSKFDPNIRLVTVTLKPELGVIQGHWN